LILFGWQIVGVLGETFLKTIIVFALAFHTGIKYFQRTSTFSTLIWKEVQYQYSSL